MPPASPKSGVFAEVISKLGAIAVIAGLSLITHAYKRALEPLYGSAPVELHLNKVIWAASILGGLAPTVPVPYAMLGLGMLLYAFPSSSYWVAVYTGRYGDPVWGPVATHVAVLFPVLGLGVAVVKALQEKPAGADDGAPQQLITAPVSATGITSLLAIWPVLPWTRALTEAQILLNAGTLSIVSWAVAPLLASDPPKAVAAPAPPADAPAPAPKGKSKKNAAKNAAPTPPAPAAAEEKAAPGGPSVARLALIPLLPFITSTLLKSPTLPQPLSAPYVHPTYPLRILSTARSDYSGVVVVGEALPAVEGGLENLRYLRAGHSLLGGVWVGDKVNVREPLRDEAGEPLGDSIYSAFVLQEAARMVQRPDGRKAENALMIGLGAGIAATAFKRHGLDTTVVEIDPVVYDAAKRYFGLPPPSPERLVLQDARSWVMEQKLALDEFAAATEAAQKESTQPALFDIVVHDCFSGGSVPGHLFTQQFWYDLKNITDPNGVVAVNFAGNFNGDSAKAVTQTLRSVFPQCRALHDTIQGGEEDDEFKNWVFFCTPSDSPIKFRSPKKSDYLGSSLRQHILSSLSGREGDLAAVDASIVAKDRQNYILRDERNPLVLWQQKAAVHHWKIMRNVLPDVFWETY